MFPVGGVDFSTRVLVPRHITKFIVKADGKQSSLAVLCVNSIFALVAKRFTFVLLLQNEKKDNPRSENTLETSRLSQKNVIDACSRC